MGLGDYVLAFIKWYNARKPWKGKAVTRSMMQYQRSQRPPKPPVKTSTVITYRKYRWALARKEWKRWKWDVVVTDDALDAER